MAKCIHLLGVTSAKGLLDAVPGPHEVTPHSSAAVPDPGEVTPHSSAAVPDPGEVTLLSSAAVSDPREVTPLSSAAVPDPREITPHSSAAVPDPGEVTSHSSVAVPDPREITPHTSAAVPDPWEVTPHFSPAVPDPWEITPHSSAAVPDPREVIPHSSAAVPDPWEVTPHSSATVPDPREVTNRSILATNEKFNTEAITQQRVESFISSPSFHDFLHNSCDVRRIATKLHALKAISREELDTMEPLANLRKANSSLYFSLTRNLSVTRLQLVSEALTFDAFHESHQILAKRINKFVKGIYRMYNVIYIRILNVYHILSYSLRGLPLIIIIFSINRLPSRRWKRRHCP